MEQAIKNVKFCSRKIDGTRLVISINGIEVLDRDVLDYPDSVRTYALMDRFSSKLVDSVANLSKANDATKAKRVILDLDAQLREGNWNKPAVSGPKEIFPLADLVEGLLAALKKTPEGKATTEEQVQGMLEALDVAGRNGVANNAAVKAEVLAVQVRRAQAEAKKEPSLGDLLAKLTR
jgi:hypothetical protein